MDSWIENLGKNIELGGFDRRETMKSSMVELLKKKIAEGQTPQHFGKSD